MRAAIISAAVLIAGMIYHIAHLLHPDVIPEAVSWGQTWPALISGVIFLIWDLVEIIQRRASDAGKGE